MAKATVPGRTMNAMMARINMQGRAGSAYRGGAEVRILDDAEAVAKRIDDCGHADALADVRDGIERRRSELQEPGVRRLDVVDPPQRLRPVGPRSGIRHEPQLEATHRETDIERLIEVRGDAEQLRVPVPRCSHLRRG